ncbi:MAG: hypothetical protein JSV52_05035 [Candidatus Zixiibacteriota bacterium]|nr:MAG: hypothetical protein JSV52_05035 [candidate division Zixibacteria bacterium]
MESVTRALNMLSAIIMFIAGLYIQIVFGVLLTTMTAVLLWIGILVYAGLQVEFGYGVLRKHLAELWR